MTPRQRGDTSLVDRLDQLFARSKREIEAHTGELGDIGTGHYFIAEAAQLLSALRLWAQNQYRSDRVVRDILEAGDVVVLRDVAHELRQLGTADAETASWTIAGMTNKSSGELMAIAAYATGSAHRPERQPRSWISSNRSGASVALPSLGPMKSPRSRAASWFACQRTASVLRAKFFWTSRPSGPLSRATQVSRSLRL